MGILKSGESIPIKMSGFSRDKNSFSDFLSFNNLLRLTSGSMIPITDISLISKKESKPSEIILEPPTPINSILG